MPVLRNEDVPAHHASKLVVHLLHISEIIFPKLNAIGTFGNLVMTAAILRQGSSASPELSRKLPFVASSLALSIGVTIYALTVMVPVNSTMKEMASRMKRDESDKEAARVFRECQARWQRNNMGRALLMIAGAVVSIIGLIA
ncbi:uncharacterized protein PV09_06589 [Verruconis gallopava]|uniref:DUF1772 domain-containing protein n=1 Tax=Verruconis gallopava TaxID=253628 RepID=A0A0D2ASF0_9PEZI|nr:uncharacterized protein PV09_06589 [Verruconis gallopava]KIW02099.1 hypothetical protein PV09_06589 [Verruconis gallopava]